MSSGAPLKRMTSAGRAGRRRRRSCPLVRPAAPHRRPCNAAAVRSAVRCRARRAGGVLHHPRTPERGRLGGLGPQGDAWRFEWPLWRHPAPLHREAVRALRQQCLVLHAIVPWIGAAGAVVPVGAQAWIVVPVCLSGRMHMYRQRAHNNPPRHAPGLDNPGRAAARRTGSPRPCSPARAAGSQQGCPSRADRDSERVSQALLLAVAPRPAAAMSPLRRAGAQRRTRRQARR